MDERVDIFLENYREQMPGFLSDIEKHAREHNIPVMSKRTGDVIRYTLHTIEPSSVLEIGTAVGFSALFMKTCVSPQTRITTIEKIEARYSQAEVNFSRYDKEHQIELIKEDASEAIERFKSEGKRYQFIFLDAAKAQYSAFLPTLIELLETGGVLISDNVLHHGVVMSSRYAVSNRDRTIHERLRKYLKEVSSHPMLETLILPMDDGITISRKLGKQ